jgi:uncharacterized membrane protein
VPNAANVDPRMAFSVSNEIESARRSSSVAILPFLMVNYQNQLSRSYCVARTSRLEAAVSRNATHETCYEQRDPIRLYDCNGEFVFVQKLIRREADKNEELAQNLTGL